MKIEGKIVIRSKKAPQFFARITQSLEPDNVANITTEYDKDSVTTRFTSEKIGSLIATIDDYLMNARIAQDVILAIDTNNIPQDDD